MLPSPATCSRFDEILTIFPPPDLIIALAAACVPKNTP